MSLIHLFDPLRSATDLDRFVGYNFSDHLLVIDAIIIQRSITIPLIDIRTLDPIQPSAWNLNHQAMHNAINAVLQLPGSDFTLIDFGDEVQLASVTRLHAEEHRQWHLKLNLV